MPMHFVLFLRILQMLFPSASQPQRYT